ncbi:MAG: hypothetical protein Ct9H300mP23_12040 [Nitrospinota bacterium]|nr:MAG: hypothetical protein Ct9H300mP23_12040 [Nitrospinota bacterium]
MIQGGDPNSKNEDRSSHGMGGPGYTIKAEFNDTPHDRGVLSMARRKTRIVPVTVFYCSQRCSLFRWKIHRIWQSVSGMDVADKIVNSPLIGTITQ